MDELTAWMPSISLAANPPGGGGGGSNWAWSVGDGGCTDVWGEVSLDVCLELPGWDCLFWPYIYNVLMVW